LADSTSNMNYKLFTPAGDNFGLSNPFTLDNSFFQMIVPPQVGTYYLVQSNRNNATATFGFQILDAGASAVLPLNATNQDTLDPGSSSTLYKFAGTAGERVFLQVISGANGRFDILDPTGKEIGAVSLSSSNGFPVTLPGDGTYYLGVLGDGANTNPQP